MRNKGIHLILDRTDYENIKHKIITHMVIEAKGHKPILVDLKVNIPYDTENDIVNRPAHYTDGKIEVIEYIEDKKLGFCLGNAIKYISRAGKKDPSKEIEDLQKAKWYIERRIKELTEV